MRRIGWIGAAMAALVVAAVTVWRPDRALRVGAGVAAHHVCSMTFVGGQPPQATWRELVVPMIGRFAASLLRVRVDRPGHRVEVRSRLRTLAVASYVPGYGCRLDLPGNLPLTPVASASTVVRDPMPMVTTASPAIAAALDRVFDEQPDEPLKRVKAVVVMKDGRIVAERYAPGFGVDSPLISFSVAKSFTNALLGVLARQGRVNMRAPLRAPGWSAMGDPRRDITLEDLLRMQSGLAAEEAESAFSPVARMEFLHADMAAFAAGRPARIVPGKRFEYTSANTVLLDHRLGRIIGGGAAGVREFARRKLFAPLGMGPVTMEVDGAGTFIGSTYVYATARDYARLGLLYANDGVAPDGQRLLPPGWVAWSRTSVLGAPYGAGFWTNDGPSDEARWRVHEGFPKEGFYASGTMGQRIYIVPSEGLVVVRFGYSTPPNYGMRDDMALIKAVRAALPRGPAHGPLTVASLPASGALRAGQ